MRYQRTELDWHQPRQVQQLLDWCHWHQCCVLRMLCSDCRLWFQELQGCLPAWMVQAGLPRLHSTCPGRSSSMHWHSCWISFSLHGDRGVRANHDDLVGEPNFCFAGSVVILWSNSACQVQALVVCFLHDVVMLV